MKKPKYAGRVIIEKQQRGETPRTPRAAPHTPLPSTGRVVFMYVLFVLFLLSRECGKLRSRGITLGVLKSP